MTQEELYKRYCLLSAKVNSGDFEQADLQASMQAYEEWCASMPRYEESLLCKATKEWQNEIGRAHV